MCRLMGFVSDHSETIAEIAGPTFGQFTDLSAKHGDGWGISAINSTGAPELILEPGRASESARFAQTAHSLQSDGALLHLRWATLGLAISEGNTHPFAFEEMSFIHNGSINPPSSLDKFIVPDLIPYMRGETDSEKYFFAIVTQVRRLGLQAGILAAVRAIAAQDNFSSINAMILTPEYFFTICEHNDAKIPDDEGPGYYDLAYRADARGIIAASSGWDQAGWTNLPNHRILEVKRATLQSALLTI